MALQKLARYTLQWKSPEKLNEKNYSLEISLKDITQVEKALCGQTFSLKPLDMTKTEWKVLPFFPLSDTVHLVGTTLFLVSPPVLQLQPWGSQTFSNYWTESLVPGGSWVARPHMEISQPKHIKERDVLFHREESISLGLSI